jgi:ABC-type branched-subunit amino acid transport system substrate-binding protein
MPDEAIPFGKFAKPYKEWFVEPNTIEYNGAARDIRIPELYQSKTVNIGFLGPIDPTHPEARYGVAMLNGAKMAIDEANARGGYGARRMSGGKPYALKVHNDLPLWGASSTEIVKMDFDEHVVAVLGAIDGATTHIMIRVTLKLEIPVMDTGTTDPTVTETRIQWLVHNFPDDRQQGYALADYIFKQLGLKRIGVLRTQSRYARIGVAKFADEARRMGRPVVLELKFERGDTDFSTQLRMLKDGRIDGLVIWGEPPEAGLVLKQMRAMGIRQPAFGASRLAYRQLLETAGPAAEGFVCTSAIDPSRKDPQWLEFEEKYRKAYQVEPDAYAAWAYDGVTMLTKAIDKAGLNRGLIMDALREYQLKEYDGVAGRAQFDYTLNNIAPITLARVEGGKFVYFPARRREPPASAGAGSR